ncbi:3-ketoacyl-ACP reductase like protein [Coleophoma cylindrospora]|uniref:3-ketoacyl-ACP reductase like protein n=1 Tax=Coleophoma cylindrospora TaxID=1849047 RepID=A0A3D8QCT2_9HELO|nr:3-ketoacyl-ACP reductase like protein [Coleophoma cylindrospora]
MQLGLNDKVIVVTGGTKGIGRAIVEAFLAEGAEVHFCSRTESDVKSAQSALQSAGKAFGAVVDVSKPEQVAGWIKKVAESGNGIDVVVPNVSALNMSNTADGWKSAFDIDMMGTFSLVDAALPSLEKTKGNIVTISSVSGKEIDFTAPSPYGSFKAALIHYTAQLARTLAPKGIRANTVSPGNIYIADGVWGNVERGNPELFKSQFEKNPFGRMGKAEEIANAVVFLASEKASFISGTNLVVDGALCNGVQF